MTKAVIVSAARTPVGSFLGAFANVPAHDLGAAVLAEVVARRLLVHGVEQIAGAALSDALGGPERRVQLGRERVRSVSRGADPEQCHVL